MSETLTQAPDGAVTQAGEGVYDLRYERRLAVPVAKVWAALTEPERLSDWLALATVDLRVGGTIELRWPEMGDANLGVIVELDPPRLFTFTWSEPDGAPGSVVRWELSEDTGGGCRLVLTNTLLRPSALIDIGVGWHVILDDLPGAALRDHPRPWTTERIRHARARAATLVPRYRASLPREAAQVEWVEWSA